MLEVSSQQHTTSSLSITNFQAVGEAQRKSGVMAQAKLRDGPLVTPLPRQGPVGFSERSITQTSPVMHPQVMHTHVHGVRGSWRRG